MLGLVLGTVTTALSNTSLTTSPSCSDDEVAPLSPLCLRGEQGAAGGALKSSRVSGSDRTEAWAVGTGTGALSSAPCTHG